MEDALRAEFESEMSRAEQAYRARDFESCFGHLERAHVLGQRHYWPHLRSHWWMLKAGWQIGDRREVRGQIMRIIGSVGSLVGLVPLGNIGRAHVSALRPMPIPEDLAIFFPQSMRGVWPRRVGWVAGSIALLLVASALIGHRRQQRGIEVADEIWRSSVIVPLVEIGETQRLSILPLVNWHVADGGLKGEAGVAYLVRTDRNTLLFDFGFNREQESPSPLEHNMLRLGVGFDEIDTLFLSHRHPDHSGGSHWSKEGSFSLGTEQVDLGDKRIFAPIGIHYPGAQVTTVEGPRLLGDGLASIGPIRRQLANGPVDEQALAINVAGRGIVLLVGCGHQRLERIIERTERLFDQPIHGIIGDLHYPLPEGRLKLFGINLQHRLASGTGPLSPMTCAEVASDLSLLRSPNLGIVALGGHDTSDEVIAEIERIFGAKSHRVRVGEWIEIAN